jgi:hypothetical protein
MHVNPYTILLCRGTYPVEDLRLELDSGLDDINGSQGTVGDGTTKSTSESEPVCQQRLA